MQPPNPGRLQIEGTETQYHIAQRKNEHAEATRLFREVIRVEIALIQQIVSAVEGKYLKSLQIPITNKITKQFPNFWLLI